MKPANPSNRSTPIIRSFDLAEFIPGIVRADGQAAIVHVWVNPPQAMLKRGSEMFRRWKRLHLMIDEAPDLERKVALQKQLTRQISEIVNWQIQILSKAADKKTHWTASELTDLAVQSAGPVNLYQCLLDRTMVLLTDHLNGRMTGRN